MALLVVPGAGMHLAHKPGVEAPDVSSWPNPVCNIVPADLGCHQVQRFGEAENPGPTEAMGSFVLGTVNPTGVRNKEGLLTELGQGIWTVTETQLSSVTSRSSAICLKSLARQQGRQVRVMQGAPAPIRTHSDWAGGWTGVLCMSDYPSRQLQLPWGEGVFQSGRIMAAFHDIGGVPITGAVIYGYPASSSHPRAREATDSLLSDLTRQLMFGRTGPRYIAGDFNHDPSQLSEAQLWKEQGWCEVQSLAWRLWGQEPKPTCKQATQRDLVFISPEMLDWCAAVTVEDLFADHSVVQTRFQMPASGELQRAWIVPSVIPWGDINAQEWRAAEHPTIDPSLPSTEWLKQFAKDFEGSLGGYVQSPIGPGLPRLAGMAKFGFPTTLLDTKFFRGTNNFDGSRACHMLSVPDKLLPTRRCTAQNFGIRLGIAGLSVGPFTLGGKGARSSCREALPHFRNTCRMLSHVGASLMISRPISRPLSPGTTEPANGCLITSIKAGVSSFSKSWQRAGLSPLIHLSSKRCTRCWRRIRMALRFREVIVPGP